LRLQTQFLALLDSSVQKLGLFTNSNRHYA